MISFWGDYKRIKKLFNQFTDEVSSCLENSFNSLKVYIQEGETEEASVSSDLAHKAETNADNVRREIINDLVKGSLLPNTRADFMALLEYIDDVADHSENLLDHFFLLALSLDKIDSGKIEHIMDKTIEQFNILQQTIKLLFSDMKGIMDKTSQIEKIESEIDDIEEALIRQIACRDDLDIAEKLVYKDFISKVAYLADIIENAGDQVELIVAVRKA